MGFRIYNQRKVLPDAYIVTNGQKEYRLNKSHVKKDTSVCP